MIDLTIKGLPDAIELNGKSFSIKTDFREWIKFDQLVRENRPVIDFMYLFSEPRPSEAEVLLMSEDLLSFFQNPNSTPNNQKGSGERISDYLQDGEFIYAAFMETYNIDLIETEMHWHKFKALFMGLSSECLYSKIVSWRGYEKDTKDFHQQMTELKNNWALPIEEDNSLFLEFQQKIGIS